MAAPVQPPTTAMPSSGRKPPATTACRSITAQPSRIRIGTDAEAELTQNHSTVLRLSWWRCRRTRRMREMAPSVRYPALLSAAPPPRSRIKR